MVGFPEGVMGGVIYGYIGIFRLSGLELKVQGFPKLGVPFWGSHQQGFS